jgi:hypothetical protein
MYRAIDGLTCRSPILLIARAPVAGEEFAAAAGDFSIRPRAGFTAALLSSVALRKLTHMVGTISRSARLNARRAGFTGRIDTPNWHHGCVESWGRVDRDLSAKTPAKERTDMWTLIFSLALLVALGSPNQLRSPTASSRQPVQHMSDAAVLADFQARVHEYAQLHRCLEGPVPTVTVSENWTEVHAAIQALAAKIRVARKAARRGEIFSPDIERVFRRMIGECLQGCAIDDLLASLNEENPEGLVLVPRVNDAWPAEASYGPMPPHLLATLPPLPEELQYRFMNRDLVLLDVHANVIVDFIRKALP